jgi:hypothetical protein
VKPAKKGRAADADEAERLAAMQAEVSRAYARGVADGRAEAQVAVRETFERIKAVIDQGGIAVQDVLEISGIPHNPDAVVEAVPAAGCKTDDKFARPMQRRPSKARITPAAIDILTGPEARMLGALAWWEAVGKPSPSRAMLAAIARWKITSGHIKNVLGSLSSKGLVTYPDAGRVAMTEVGRKAAPAAALGDLHEAVRAILTGPQRTAFDALLRLGEASREDLCATVGWNPTSGHPKNVLGSMSSMELVEYPRPGFVRLVEWLR